MLSFKAWICIEIGEEGLYVWSVQRNGNLAEILQSPLSTQTLWDAQALANMIHKPISSGRVLILLNSAQTVLRLTDYDDIHYAFPIGEGFYEKDYDFSHSLIGDIYFMAAIPNSISKCLVEFCRIINLRNIHILDTVEYRMAYYFGKIQKEPTWLFINQGAGVRLIALNNGIPHAIYFLSKDPEFRILELERIWACQLSENIPQHAVIFPNNLDWLCNFITQKAVSQIEFPDFRKTLLQNWVKQL